MITHLLLDFDGTLFDTEPVALPSLIARFNELFAAELRAGGHKPLTLAGFMRDFHGLSRQSLAAALERHYGFSVPLAALYDDRERRIVEAYADHSGGIPIAQGLADALEALVARGLTPAVVSNNPVGRALAAIRHASDPEAGTRLLTLLRANFFEAGARPKPSADVYLTAMRALRVRPEHAAAVEDSAAGIAAARAAGIAMVFGFTGFAEDGEAAARALLAAGAIATFNDWREAEGTIGQVFRVSLP
jgi:beta-phosphoglucomutase-like phosphatase (HAD superfamily)